MVNMTIKLSANVQQHLAAQGVSIAKIAELQQSEPPPLGGFLDIALGQPLTRQFSNESSLFNPFVDKQLVVVNEQIFLLDSGLGQGNFGAVYKGVNLETGEESAIKFSDVSKEDDGTFSIPLENERKTLAKKGELLGSGQGPGKKSDDNNCHLTIMPLVKGPNLEDALYSKHKNNEGDVTHVTKNDLPLVEKLIIAAQMLDELEDLHNLGVLHRDFKPDNMHWDNASKKLTVIDFGETHHTAKAMPIPDSYSIKEEYHSGSYLYSSPEAMNKREYSVKSDGYSAGLVLADLFCDYNLLQDKNDKAQMPEFKFESDRNPAVIKDLLTSIAQKGSTADMNSFMAQAVFAGAIRPLVNPDPLARANIGSAAKQIKLVATSLLAAKNASDLGLSSESEKFQLITKFNSSLAEKKISLILSDPDNQAFLSKYNKSAIIGASHHIADALKTLQENLAQKNYAADSPTKDFNQNIEIGKAVMALEKELASIPQDHKCVREVQATLIDMQKDINLNSSIAYAQLQSLKADKNNSPNIESGINSIMAKIQSFHEAGKISEPKSQATIVTNMDQIVARMDEDGVKNKHQEKVIALFEGIKSDLKLPAVQNRQALPVAAASSSSTPDASIAASSSSAAPVPSLDLTKMKSSDATFSPRPGAPQPRELTIESARAPLKQRGDGAETEKRLPTTKEKEDSGSPSVKFSDEPPSRPRKETAASVLSNFQNYKEKTRNNRVQKPGADSTFPKEEAAPNKLKR
tara:strand:+ start:307 stop:2547 length:2241 start_codon:yes stop_codon:yes gene_type:complete